MLSGTPPLLGKTASLSLTGGSPGNLSTLFVSLPGAAPLDLGGGCTVFVDPSTAVRFLPVQVGPSGDWFQAFAIPGNPAAAGFGLVLQALFLETSGPLGIDLSNGILITLGS